MKRQQLRTKLAEVIQQSMQGHRLTIPNCRRYITQGVRVSFSIRRNTRITDDDWRAAIELAKPKPVINSVPKVDRTPTQLDWKPAILERLHYLLEKKLIGCLEHNSRVDLLERSKTKDSYFSAIAIWRDGLLEHRC